MLPTPAQSIQSEVTGNFLIWNSQQTTQNSMQRRPVTTKQITTLPPILVPSLAQHLLNLTTLNTLINLFTQNQLIPPEELLLKSQSLHKSIYEPWQNCIQSFLRARRQYIKSRANNLPPDKSLRAFVLPFSDPEQIQNRLTQIKEIALNQAKAQFHQSFNLSPPPAVTTQSLPPNHSSPSPDTAAPTTTTTTTTTSHTDPQPSSHCDGTQSIQSSSHQDVPNDHNHAAVASKLIPPETQSFPLAEPDEPLSNTVTLRADTHHSISSHQDVSQSDQTTESSSNQRVTNEDTHVAECSKTTSSQVQTLVPVSTGHPDKPFHNTVVGSAITPADQSEYASFSSFNPTPLPSSQQCTQSLSSYPATQPIPCKVSTSQHFSSPQSVHYHQVQPTPLQPDHPRRPLPQSGRVVSNQDYQTFRLVSQPQTYSRSNVSLQGTVHQGQSAPQNLLHSVGPSSCLMNTTPSLLPSPPSTRGPVLMTELQLQAYHANEKVEAERMYLRGLHQLNHQFNIFMMQEGLVDPVKGSQAIKIREQELIKRRNHFNNFMLVLAHKQQGQLHAMREMRHRVSHVVQTQCLSAISSIPGFPLVAPSHGINPQYGPNLVSSSLTSSTPTNQLRSVPTNTIGSLGHSHQIENRSAVTLNHSNSLPLHNPSTQLFSSPSAAILTQGNLSSPTRTDPQACLSSPTVTHASFSSPVQISHSIQLYPHHPHGITNDESNNNHAKDDQNKESSLMMMVGKRKRAISYPIGRSSLDGVKYVQQVIAQTNTSDEVNNHGKKINDVDLTRCDPPLKKAKLGQPSRNDGQLDNNNNNDTLPPAPSHIQLAPTPVTRSTQAHLPPESSSSLQNSTGLHHLSPDSTSASSGLHHGGLVKNPSSSFEKPNLGHKEEQVHQLNNMVKKCQSIFLEHTSYKSRRSRSPSSSSSSSSSTKAEYESGNNGKKKRKLLFDTSLNPDERGQTCDGDDVNEEWVDQGTRLMVENGRKESKKDVDISSDGVSHSPGMTSTQSQLMDKIDDLIPKNDMVVTTLPNPLIQLKMTSSSSLLFSSSSSSSILLSHPSFTAPSSSTTTGSADSDSDSDDGLFINLQLLNLHDNHNLAFDNVDNWFTLSL